jgi:dTDP-4-amino-4,6-dideoxygalactose transaminase
VGVHYLAIPEHPFYQQQFGWSPDAYPSARDVGRRTVSLPLSARLSDDDVDDVIEALTRVLR